MDSIDALDRVRIVLCHTSHPGNIGAAARAMKTMGLSRMVLVDPRRFPDAEADAFAAGAGDVLHGATVCDSLDAALAGTALAVASTSRVRGLAPETVDCRTACERLVMAGASNEVALVFGPERTGLTRSQVSKCSFVASIPADPAYASLNIAQAVQVFAYELRMAAMQGAMNAPSSTEFAAHEEVEHFYVQLEQTLFDLGFLDRDNPRQMMRRLRRLFARSRLEKAEINILMGLLRAVRTKVE